AYSYRIVGVDTAGNQGAESAARNITCGDVAAPYAPTSLTATPGNAYVSLAWTAPSNPDGDLAGYYLYRRTATTSFGAPLNAYPLIGTYYDDLNLINGKTYYYIVKAVDTSGLVSAQSNQASATPKIFYSRLDRCPLPCEDETHTQETQQVAELDQNLTAA